MRCLVIGQTSFLGQRLYTALISRGHKVYGTARKNIDKSHDILEFDLSSPKDDWPVFPEKIDCVFFSSAMTNQNEIEKSQDKARFINVDKTLEVMNFLIERGAHILFPSTNLVLANDTPDQKTDDPYKPQSFYASLKAEVEQELLKMPANATICRLPKILDSSTPLISEWRTQLKSKKTIHALTDLFVAPVSVSYAINILLQMMEKRAGVIIHMSGQEVSYFTIAQLLAERLGVPKDLVIPQTSADAGISLASSPRHPSLDTSRTEEIFGISSQSLDELISHLVP